MSINIKKSHRGLLHKDLGVKQGEKIPASKLKVKSTDSPAVKKRKVFAQNARKWNHAQEGVSLPSDKQIQLSDDEMYKRLQQEQLLRSQNQVGINQNNYSGDIGDYSQVTQGVDYQPIEQDQNTIPRSYSPEQRSYNGVYGDIALGGLLAVDSLIPNKKQPSQVVRPLNSYNERPYGTGSRAIAQSGTKLTPKFKKPEIPLSYEEMQRSAPSATSPEYSGLLNPQQQYFYKALSNPSNNLVDIYKGFNEELTGVNSQDSQTVHPESSPFSGTYLLNNDDKALLQGEYLNYRKYRGNKENYFNDLRKRAANDQRLSNLVPAASFALGQTYENGGKISNTGYKTNSPDRYEPSLTIPSNQITMENVPHAVYGIDDTGYQQVMYPEQDYTFPGNYVREIPMKKMGGKICKSGGKLPYNEGETYNLSDNEIRSLIAQGYEIKIH